MKKELSTENELMIGCMATILKPIFLDDKEDKYTQAQLVIARRVVEYEQKFYNLPDAKDRVLRKNSLGILLYQFVIYKHNKVGEPNAAHQYVTQDITDRSTGHTIIPKQQVKQAIWDMYNPDFTGIDLSKFKEATIGLDMSVEIKKVADYGGDYFEKDVRYQASCGKFKENATASDFLLRINSLLYLHDYLQDVLIHALGVRQAKIAKGGEEKSNEYSISTQEYRQFDISKLLIGIEEITDEFINIQIKHLSEYLSSFKKKVGVLEIVRRLINLCLYIPKCSLTDRPYLQQLIDWEFQRMQIGVVACGDLKIETVRSKLRLFCFKTLLPKADNEIKFPTREDLAYSDNKEILEYIPPSMLGKSLPKKCSEIYFSHSAPKVSEDEKIITLEKELKDEKDQEKYLAKEQKISIIQNTMVEKSIQQMQGVEREQLDIVRQRLLLLFKQESYQRRLMDKVLLLHIKSFLESQLSIIKIQLAENAKKEAKFIEKTKKLSPPPPPPPERHVSVLSRWTPEQASSASLEIKKPNIPGKLKITQLRTVETVLTAGRGRGNLPVVAPSSAPPGKTASSSSVFVLPSLSKQPPG